jgi:hypothetical protein
MNKKTIIQIVIIIVAFGAAGLVLYNGFFNSNNSAGLSAAPVQSATTQNIFPYGETLDFSRALDFNRFQYNQIVYPQLDPQKDVGISQDSLIISLPVAKPGQ